MNYLNWVDLVMIVVLAAGINSGRKSDFFGELIVLSGVLLTTCVTLHYYVRFGYVLNDNVTIPKGTHEFLAFITLASGMIGLTVLAKSGWLSIIKIDLNKHVDNWGSLGFSIIKSYILCSLVLFTMAISGFPSIENSSKKSYSFIVFSRAPVWIYSVCYRAFIDPFFTDEPLNKKAFRVIQTSS